MMSTRINAQFVNDFNSAFTEEIAREYRQYHEENCHHWDYTFLPWHRKYLNRFWSSIGLPRTYAVLTEAEDRALYTQLRKTIVAQDDGTFRFFEDPNKLNSFTSYDLRQIRSDIAEAMSCTTFALDLDDQTSNRLRELYNLSFTSQVEEFHDIVHGETGQGMRSVRTAGGDQCFAVHHTFVDLVFETWLNDVYGDNAAPITPAHYDASSELQQDYESYEELESLFTQRHFSEQDYGHVRRIVEPLRRQAVVFERIEHRVGFRRVIMFHREEEIGRFAVLTGRLETCLACARREFHTGQFLLRELVPIREILWNIDNEWYDWESAVKRFEDIGMSQPLIVSF
ncbi:MAG: tyrosinase family protein [Gammaproteobacteria bacterium]|nr:tyrosinase family protein [Gammaproteobacteria bacterium]